MQPTSTFSSCTWHPFRRAAATQAQHLLDDATTSTAHLAPQVLLEDFLEQTSSATRISTVT